MPQTILKSKKRIQSAFDPPRKDPFNLTRSSKENHGRLDDLKTNFPSNYNL